MRGLLYTLLAIVLAFVVVVGGWLYANRDTVRITVFDPDAEDLLEKLIAGSGLPFSPVGDVERWNVDGNQPEAAIRSYQVPRTRAVINRALQRVRGT